MADAIVVCLAARPTLETQSKQRRLALMLVPKPGVWAGPYWTIRPFFTCLFFARFDEGSYDPSRRLAQNTETRRDVSYKISSD